MKKKFNIISLFFVCFFSLSGGFLLAQKTDSPFSQEWQHIFEKVKKGIVQIESHHAEFSWDRPDLPSKIIKQTSGLDFL